MAVFFADLDLPSTQSKSANLGRLSGLSVVFIYPYTGRPGFADPPGWDDIKGAHGSTPQALSYKALHAQFKAMRVHVFGMSFQDTKWQQEFATRHLLPFALLSDDKAEVALLMSLKTFRAGQQAFLMRRTMIIANGRVIHDREIVSKPEQDASDVLNWLKTR